MVISKKVKKFKRSFKKKRFSKRKRFGKKKSYKKKRFGRRRHRKNLKDRLTSSDFRYEEGGTAQSYGTGAGTPQAVTVGQDIFVGHAPVGNHLMTTFWTALVKKLMAKYGIFYSNEQEQCIKAVGDTQTFKIYILWRKAEDDYTLTSTPYTIVAGDGVRVVGSGLDSAFQTAFRSGVGTSNWNWPRLKELKLVKEYTNTTVIGEVVAQLPLDRAVVKVNLSSTLKIQNKTGTEGGSSSTDALGLNPLQCRLYKGKGYKNYIPMKNNVFQDVNNTTSIPNFKTRNWVPESDTASATKRNGLIFDNDLRHTLNCFQALPTRKEVECSSVKDFVLHPAQIVKDSLAFRSTISIDNFIKRIFTTMTDNPYETMEFGIAHVIGMDKLLYDRSSAAITTAPILVGYQIESRYVVDTSFKRLRSSPYVQINNLAIGQPVIQ